VSVVTFCHDIKMSKFRPLFFLFSDGVERGISRIGNIIIGPKLLLQTETTENAGSRSNYISLYVIFDVFQMMVYLPC